MPEEQVAQQADVSTQEVKPSGTDAAVPVTAVKPPEPEHQKLPDIEAMIKAKLDEYVAPIKRELQSTKDKAKYEVERMAQRTMTAEQTLRAARARLALENPEAAKDMELQELRGRVTNEEQTARQLEARNAQEEFHKQFKASLEESLQEMGVDTKDSKLDWAEDAPNYIEAQKRVLKSAAKIKKEAEQAAQTKYQTDLQTKLKDLEARLRKEFGVDSVDTTASGGVVDNSDTAFIAKVARGDTLTKQDYERARKLGLG